MRELLILMVVIWTAGQLFRRLGLPTVFGELLGGILVGPALLDIVDADSETIRVLSDLGMFFLMLHTGLKTDPRKLLGASNTAVVVGISGTLLSFAGGYAVGTLAGLTSSAALFLGLGLSVSAIPIAARVFKENGLEGSRMAHITLGSAVISDVVALVLFSMIMSSAEGRGFHAPALLALLVNITLFFIIVLWGGLRTGPLLHRFLSRGRKAFTLTLIVALLLAMIAEAIGLHGIIGAFLAGLFMQEELMDPNLYAKIEDRFYGLAYSFFGPVFFASLAFHLQFNVILEAPVLLLMTILVAILGKLLGSGLTARALGIPTGESLLIGVSMNSRGAVELVIAAIGLEQGLIDAVIFSLLITMAFTTTLLSILCTGPLARRLTSGMPSA